ncbi:MAG: hypothetical protein A2521_10970 [Deltaproteobacteria bacterium RIFOXYD12_FULL_57_12]|nr:MAG: hypothetical protein A2521_10970 [Deltaproteobacteria bacterium RIFOXYD12_FULL_57_12]
MDHLYDIIRKRLPPGILIIDFNNRLLYSNREALALLPSLQPAETPGKKKRPVIPAEILHLCEQIKRPPTTVDGAVNPQKIETDCALMINGEKQYFSLRAFLIGGHGRNCDASHTMVLVEKVAEKHDYNYDLNFLSCANSVRWRYYLP